MKIQLICSDSLRPQLDKMLKDRGYTVTDQPARIACVEKGLSANAELILTFDKEHPALLEDFISFSDGQLPVNSTSEVPLLLGRNGDCFEVIHLEKICFFQADDDYVFCRTTTGCFEVKPKLYQLEELYQRKGFFRISKSVVVNIMAVSEVVPWFGGRLLLRLASIGDKVEVSRSYVRKFKGFLGM